MTENVIRERLSQSLQRPRQGYYPFPKSLELILYTRPCSSLPAPTPTPTRRHIHTAPMIVVLIEKLEILVVLDLLTLAFAKRRRRV